MLSSIRISTSYVQKGPPFKEPVKEEGPYQKCNKDENNKVLIMDCDM